MDYSKIKETELFLFDMDGTLYLGDDVYPGAIELMEDLPALGKKYIYLTNNSSRAGADYITRLRELGFPCEAENVFTSGMATAMYIKQNYPDASVYLAGTKAFHRELTSYGIKLVNDDLGRTDADTVDIVVQGFDTELVYEKLDKAVFALHRFAAGVHKHKTTGAVSVFHVAGIEAALTKEGTLLIACSTGDDYLASVKRSISLSVDMA